MVNNIHDSVAGVNDSENVSLSAISYTTFKYHYKEEMDAQYTYWLS